MKRNEKKGQYSTTLDVVTCKYAIG